MQILSSVQDLRLSQHVAEVSSVVGYYSTLTDKQLLIFWRHCAPLE